MARRATPADDPASVVEACLARFDPPIAAQAFECLDALRALAPGAIELVYDAYNAFAVAFATSERLGDAFVGIAAYPRHVNLTFPTGAALDDPAGLLVGEGSSMRHVRVEGAATLEDARVRRLVKTAAAQAGLRRGAEGRIVIKKLYERQRPRRPG